MALSARGEIELAIAKQPAQRSKRRKTAKAQDSEAQPPQTRRRDYFLAINTPRSRMRRRNKTAAQRSHSKQAEIYQRNEAENKTNKQTNKQQRKIVATQRNPADSPRAQQQSCAGEVKREAKLHNRFAHRPEEGNQRCRPSRSCCSWRARLWPPFVRRRKAGGWSTASTAFASS